MARIIRHNKVSTYVVMSVLNLLCTFALVIWWGHLLLEQNEQLAQLTTTVETERQKVMIVSEGFWFLGVLVFSVAMLIVIYFRDRRRTRSLEAFFASLTHELKTPLTSIRLQAETLEETNNAEYRKTLSERLLQDISKLENQVERALELARVEGGGTLSCRSLPLKSLIERTASGAPVIVETRFERMAATISADRYAFQTVMKNLFENTQRHGGANPAKVVIDVREKGDQVVMDYSDNGRGVGIHTKQLGQLFAKSSDSSGAGVGLYLSKALMRSMGGMMEFPPAAQGFSCRLIFRRGESV